MFQLRIFIGVYGIYQHTQVQQSHFCLSYVYAEEYSVPGTLHPITSDDLSNISHNSWHDRMDCRDMIKRFHNAPRLINYRMWLTSSLQECKSHNAIRA